MMENYPYSPQTNPINPDNSQMPVLPGLQPPSQSPVGNFKGPQNQNRRKLIALLVALVIFIAGAIALFSMFKPEGDGGKGTSPETSFKNWLEPTAEIKIGENRYVSTCKVLPAKDVIDIAHGGKAPSTFSITETYYDASPAKVQYLEPETSCYYADTATLYAEQYFDAADTKRLSSSVYTLGNTYTESKVAAYKKAVEGSNDEGLKAFVAQVESSAKTYLEKKKSSSQPGAEALDTSELIIPVGVNAVEFNVFSGNVVYRLSLESDVEASDIGSAPAAKVLTQLQQAKKMLDIVYKNASNNQLSQSPAPTILGKKAQVGDTYILEPCAVLSAGVYKSIAGIDQVNEVDRSSVVFGTDEPVVAKNGVAIFPKNECTRKSTQDSAGKSTQLTARLELEYAPDAAALDKKLVDGKYTPLNANDTQLQTAADWAVEYKVGSLEPFYKFRVGTYFGQLGLSTIETVVGHDRVQGKLTREQHVAAINTIVESLRANIKAAETNK